MDNYEYIEGLHACIEALNNDVPIKEIWIGNYLDAKTNKTVNKIIHISKSKGINIIKQDKKFLDNHSARNAHQGIISLLEPFKYCNLKEILNKNTDDSPELIVILDHIEDSGNLGAIARSAEAFGVKALVIANKRSAKVTANTYKTSAGAICNLNIAMVANINSTITELKNNGYWIASASEHSSTNIWNVNLKGKIAIVMGSEHNGVSNLILNNSDFIVKLPMRGNIESLNVAQAFSVCAYEWLRQNFS